MNEISTANGAGRYEIRLKGHLEARWAAWFDGLTLTTCSDGTTTIHGPVVDQSALHGLLQRVRDLGLPLISVTRSRSTARTSPILCHQPSPAEPAPTQQSKENDMTTTAPTMKPTPPKRVPMSSLRKTSLTAGVFYLITFVSIPTLFLYGPVKDPNYIVGAGPDTQVLIGGLLEIIVALAGIGTAVTLYPVIKRQNEGVALGFVAMRTLEAATIFAGVVSLLSIVTLRQAGAGPEALVTGQVLDAQYHWTFLLGQALLPGHQRPAAGLADVQVAPRAPDPAGAGPHRSAHHLRLRRREVLRCLRRAVRVVRARRPPDRRVGVLARRLPDRQGLQALRHHRRDDRRHPGHRPQLTGPSGWGRSQPVGRPHPDDRVDWSGRRAPPVCVEVVAVGTSVGASLPPVHL